MAENPPFQGSSEEGFTLDDRRREIEGRCGHDIGGMSAEDHERERTLAEKSTAAFDPDRQGLGSSPALRDFASSALFIPGRALPNPNLPLSSPEQRYLFRLAAQVVMAGDVCLIRGLRQAVTLRNAINITQPAATRLIEEQITSPFWHPTDGDVSWHLRVVRMPPNSAYTFDAAAAPFYALSNDLTGTEPALLYRQFAPFYAPPQLPGDGIGDLGTFYDLRFAWEHTHGTLDYVVYGPCIIMYLASVKQTDPLLRIPLPPPTYEGGVPPEELFLLNYPTAQLGHISGSIMCELGAEQRRPGIRPYVGRVTSG